MSSGFFVSQKCIKSNMYVIKTVFCHTDFYGYRNADSRYPSRTENEISDGTFRPRRSGRESVFGARPRSRSPPERRWTTESSPLETLYREMNETQRMRSELEEEKRRLFETVARSGASWDEYSRRSDISALSVRSGFAPSWADSRSTSAFGGQAREEAIPVRQGRETPSSSRPSASNTITRDSEILKPGNYLLAVWDCHLLSFDGASGSESGGDETFKPRWSGRNEGESTIAQLGAFLPHGVDMLYGVFPEGKSVSKKDLKDSSLFSFIKGRWIGRDRAGALLQTVNTREALQRFLIFLEKGCRSVRPAYDGVVLLSHIQEVIPNLVKSMRENQLYDRFQKTVKGMGDLCSYLAQCHMKRFVRGTDSSKVDLSIPAVSCLVLGERVNERSSCSRRARTTYEILEKLLEAKPTYANFLSRFLHPLDSRLITRLASFRTHRERVEACLPLRMFVARELAEQRVELVVEGVYAPSQEDEMQYLTQPQQVAVAICKLLVNSGLDFEHLLKLYREEGLEGLELTLRSSFLKNMANQPRTVIDQTIRATSLILNFFRQNGRKSFDTMMQEAKEEANRVLTEEARPSHSGVTPRPVDLELRQSEYVKMFESFKVAADYFRRRLSKRSSIPLPGKTAEDIKVIVDMLINTLIQGKMDYDRLSSVYLKDKQSYKHRNNLRNYLHLALAQPFRDHGPVELNVNQFIDLIIDFCGNHVFARQQQQSDLAAASSLLSKENLESARVALDMVIHESTRAFSELGNFRTRLLSLSSVRESVVKHLEPGVAVCGGSPQQVEQIGEHVQKLLALCGFHHVSMRQTFLLSEASLAGELFAAIRKRADLLPPGVKTEQIVEGVINYFKAYQQAIGS